MSRVFGEHSAHRNRQADGRELLNEAEEEEEQEGEAAAVAFILESYLDRGGAQFEYFLKTITIRHDRQPTHNVHNYHLSKILLDFQEGD